MARVLLSQFRPKLAKKQKNKGCWLGKRTQKVILRIKHPLFGLQHPPTSPLSIPPPTHPNFTLCAPQQRCTLHQDNNHSKQGRQRPNGGNLVHRITFCVRFPNQHPLFFCFFANLGLCWERRTADVVAATAQILGCVYLTCVASLPPCFGGLC